jgi:hypothetical protein
MEYKELAKQLRKWRKANTEIDYDLPYSDWYYYRDCLSHQKRTRADEVWFARSVGGGQDNIGKQWSDVLGREVDVGDGYIGESILPGVNNYDLKVTYQERPIITGIGFQQYRPADPIAFYAAMMGVSPEDYTLIIVPSDVAFRMKVDKISKTGKLGSAHGTGLYDNLTTEEKVNVLKEAKLIGKSSVLSFAVNKKSDKEDFELLMDKYRMRLDDVADFIKGYKETNGV